MEGEDCIIWVKDAFFLADFFRLSWPFCAAGAAPGRALASPGGRACGALLNTQRGMSQLGADGLPRRPIMSSSCAATTEINCTRPERSPLFAMYGGWIDRFRSESLTILTCDVDNWKKAAARHERPTSSEQELPDAVPFSSRRYCGREACLDSSTRPRRCTLTAATASCLSLGRVFRDLWPARVTVLPPRRQLHYSCDTGAAA